MNGLYLIVANLAYAITTTIIYLLVLKGNPSSEIAPILVVISATALLSLTIRFGGNEYVLAIKDNANVSAGKVFIERPIFFTIMFWLFSTPITVFLLILNDYNLATIVVLTLSLIIQPLGSILETVFYIWNKTNIILKSKIYGVVLVLGFYFLAHKVNHSNSFLLILFGFAPSIYLCGVAVRLGVFKFCVLSFTEIKKYVFKNYKYASLSLIYILPLTFDKIYISFQSIFEHLVVYDFQFKIATLFEVIVLGPILGLYARDRAKRLCMTHFIGLFLIGLFLIGCLSVSKGASIGVIDAFDQSIADSLEQRFILPMCFAYIFNNFVINIIKQKLIFSGCKDWLFFTYLGYAVALIFSFLLISPQTIFQVSLQLVVASFCLLVWVLVKYQKSFFGD